MNLDVDQLLTIDVESEIRKLAEAELGGSWQVPAELVRRAVRARAARVDVDLGRHAVRVADDGAPLDGETVRALQVLLNPDMAAGARHRALLELERKSEVGLIALAGLPRTGLRIVSDGVERLRLGQPRASDLPRQGTVIEVDGATLDAGEARTWLQVAVRFAPASVVLDGAELSRGAKDAIIEVPLVEPVQGTLALTRSAETARVWLLRWGVVATHTVLPAGLSVEAAVELGERSTRQIGAGELREAFKPELQAVEAQALELALAAAGQMPRLEPADRERVRLLLLGSPKLSRLPAVRRVKMLPALYGPTHALEWTSIDQLLHHAAGKSALAVDTHARAASAVTQQPIFVLSAAERTRLQQLFGVSFAPPPAAVRGGPLFSLRGLFESAERLGRALAGTVVAGWRRPLTDEALTEAERRALAVFRHAAAQPGKRTVFSHVDLCEGEGAPFVRLRARRLVLPRRNREVIAAVAAVSRDESWAYPALVALLGGAGLPASAVRDGWRG